MNRKGEILLGAVIFTVVISVIAAEWVHIVKTNPPTVTAKEVTK